MFSSILKTLLNLVSGVFKYLNDDRLVQAGVSQEKLRQVAYWKKRKREAKKALREAISDERKKNLDSKFTPMD